MPQDWGLPALIVVSLVFLGWFALGTQWNVRKGDRVLRWLQKGLPLVGERTTVQWMGSSAMLMKINKAQDPFRSAETVVLFEPRDVVFLWAWARLRSRRDTLIFRSQLRTAPPFELEIFDPQAWTSSGIERRAQTKKFSRLDLPSTQPFVAYYSGAADPASIKALIDRAALGSIKMLRVSVRRDQPNLELHWMLPDVQACSARDLFLRIRQVADDVLGK